MNFLAHQYLSRDHKEIRVGNFIADFIRGNQLESYSKGVRLGIALHRKIDEFTDSHELVHESKRLLHPRQGKYSSVLLDIYYDYFLAKNWDKYSDEPLKEFAAGVYQDFNDNQEVFPPKVQPILPSMRENDWFYNYGSYWGINKALMSIARRARHNNTIENSLQDLKDLETELEKNFLLFFPKLIQLSNDFFEEKGLNRTK